MTLQYTLSTHHIISPYKTVIVPDQIGTLSQVGTKKISKGGWTI